MPTVEDLQKKVKSLEAENAELKKELKHQKATVKGLTTKLKNATNAAPAGKVRIRRH